MKTKVGEVQIVKVASFGARVGPTHTTSFERLSSDETARWLNTTEDVGATLWLNAQGGNSGVEAGEWGLQAALFHQSNEFILRSLADVSETALCHFAAREVGASGGMDLVSVFDEQTEGRTSRTLCLLDIKAFSWSGGSSKSLEQLTKGIRVGLGTLPYMRLGRRVDRLRWVMLRGYNPNETLPGSPQLPEWHHDGGSDSGFAPRVEAIEWWGFLPFRAFSKGKPDVYMLAFGPWEALREKLGSLYEGVRNTLKKKPDPEPFLPRGLDLFSHGDVDDVKLALRDGLFKAIGGFNDAMGVIWHDEFLDITIRCGVKNHLASFIDNSLPVPEQGSSDQLFRLKRRALSVPGWKFLGEEVDKGVTRLCWTSTQWTESADKGEALAVRLAGAFARGISE